MSVVTRIKPIAYWILEHVASLYHKESLVGNDISAAIPDVIAMEKEIRKLR